MWAPYPVTYLSLPELESRHWKLEVQRLQYYVEMPRLLRALAYRAYTVFGNSEYGLLFAVEILYPCMSTPRVTQKGMRNVVRTNDDQHLSERN